MTSTINTNATCFDLFRFVSICFDLFRFVSICFDWLDWLDWLDWFDWIDWPLPWLIWLICRSTPSSPCCPTPPPPPSEWTLPSPTTWHITCGQSPCKSIFTIAPSPGQDGPPTVTKNGSCRCRTCPRTNAIVATKPVGAELTNGTSCIECSGVTFSTDTTLKGLAHFWMWNWMWTRALSFWCVSFLRDNNDEDDQD